MTFGQMTDNESHKNKAKKMPESAPKRLKKLCSLQSILTTRRPVSPDTMSPRHSPKRQKDALRKGHSHHVNRLTMDNVIGALSKTKRIHDTLNPLFMSKNLSGCEVIGIKASKLIISVPNHAVATFARYHTTEWLSAIRQAGFYEITGIRIAVAKSTPQAATNTETEEAPPKLVDPAVADMLKAITKTAHPALKSAFQKLSAKYQTRTNTKQSDAEDL